MKTVIIVGAGASEPFGFPLGRGLADAVREQLKADLLVTHFKNLSYDQSLIDDLYDSLKYGGYDTIDEFLEYNSRFRQMGSYIIASTIISMENKANIFGRKDWYRLIFDKLYARYQKGGNGNLNLSFITLNYERSLSLFMNEVSKYDAREQDKLGMEALLKSIPIVHAHGSMGSLDKVPYGSLVYQEDINEKDIIASGIRIVSDKLEESDTYKKAQGLIKAAKRVIFLGFGYHKSTMDSLFKDVNTEEYLEIWGTKYELPVYKETEMVNWSKGKIKFIDGKAVDLIRKLPF